MIETYFPEFAKNRTASSRTGAAGMELMGAGVRAMTVIKLAMCLVIGCVLSRQSPALAFAFISVCLILHLFRRPVAFVIKWLFIGLAIGEGIKMTGGLSRLQRPRRARDQHNPNDDFPENLRG
jgi:hypothetical protein